MTDYQDALVLENAKQQLATFEPCTVRCLEYFKP